MAITHGTNADVYLNGYDATGVLHKASFPVKHDIHPTPVFGKSARPKIYGVEDASPKIDGWLDNPSGIPTVLDAALVAPTSQLVYLPDGDAFGNFGWACSGPGPSQVETAVDDSPNKISATFESATGGERIVSLVPLAAVTGAVNGASHNNTVATTTKCAGFLQVHAYSGFTGVAARIEHSSDGSSWSTLANFTTVTAARSFERIEVAAGTTVQKFTRIVLTPSGVGSATVFGGFGRYPYS